MGFVLHLRHELARRRTANPRYSLRGFARSLGMHHSALLRLMSHGRPLPLRTVRRLGTRLRIDELELQRLCLAEAEHALAACIAQPGFRPDSRHLAALTGLPLDAVNLALQGLLSSGRLRCVRADRWQLTPPSQETSR